MSQSGHSSQFLEIRDSLVQELRDLSDRVDGYRLSKEGTLRLERHPLAFPDNEIHVDETEGLIKVLEGAIEELKI